ncbi:protein of unknown function DUF459 [Solidesulfovibrio carbinoliphilus subsp. oakridgensis]|uniref:Uncharacterized protein n=1 Tax=Solidesulfovibrio carbinoliphilus subsp. oakridgensis TaxID=694327 RepID=G7Q4E7_9BACT|nr:DUF459 domain-containing protein [Solidesulfovibrio carbinoliphilus]EHJ47015.1 protein of unknown function DUF459 [Solidesulfovibrio carbinoliphilus subsp. oakridgensis]
MSWKKACCIYCIALAVTVLANIEKVSVWVDDRLADGPAPELARQVRRVRNVWRELGLAASSRRIDCALAPFFDETYKNTLACRDDPTTGKAEEALRERLDPNQPVLKPDQPVDAEGLLAVLSPPLSPLSPEGEEGAPPVAAPAAPRPAPSAAPADGPSLSAGKQEAPRKVLVVGDSLAIGLSLSLRRSLAEFESMELIEEGKVSSGLANPKYYDWGKALRVFLDKYKPDIVVIMMGANDAKYINVNEKPRPAGSPNKTWPEVFAMRVENFLAALQEKNIRNYWIGLPIMGDAPYARQAEIMNDIVKAECDKFGSSRFLETWNLLADAQGGYSTFLPNEKGVKIKVRANDKVHFTVAGGDILAQSFLAAMAKDVELRPKTPDAAHAPVPAAP